MGGRWLLVAVLALVLAAASSADVAQPRITLIGDSIATGMQWHSDAIAVLENGLQVDWQVAVCRRLTGQSCPYEGQRVPNLVDLVDSLPNGVAPVVVVEMGYNDFEATFVQSVEASIKALTAAGAKRILWLTLREVDHSYVRMNDKLPALAKRYPQLTIVDWNKYSRSHPEWFQSDGKHLDETGGVAMATFIHLAVMKVVDPLTIVSCTLPAPHVGRSYAARLVAAGGTPPYRFSMVGRPPRGLHLRADGRIYGVPRAVGPVAVLIRAADAEGQTAVCHERMAVVE